VPAVTVPPEQIALGALGNQGNDGNLWTVQSTGLEIDITPEAPTLVCALSSSRPSVGNAVAGANPSAQGNDPRIWFGNKDVTDKKTVVWVGQTMNPRFEISGVPAGVASNFLWTVPGPAYSNILYDNNRGIAPLLTATNLTNSNVTFYWTAEMPNAEVSCQAVVGGKTVTAKTYFEVRKPEASLVLTPVYPVGVYTNYAGASGTCLSCGLGQNSNVCGMKFDFQMTDLKGYRGDFFDLKIMQLISINLWESFASDTNLHRCANTNGLDQVYPYYSRTIMSPILFPGGQMGDSTSDSPGNGLMGAYLLSHADAFQTYLLFEPADGKPVPLKLASWNWAGKAVLDTNSPAGYTLVSASNPSGTTGAPCSTPPTWTNCIQSANYSQYWRTNDCPNP
jgi:hypothetical protein